MGPAGRQAVVVEVQVQVGWRVSGRQILADLVVGMKVVGTLAQAVVVVIGRQIPAGPVVGMLGVDSS